MEWSERTDGEKGAKEATNVATQSSVLLVLLLKGDETLGGGLDWIDGGQ